MSPERANFVRWHSSGTVNQDPWRFARIFTAVAPRNHLLHISSANTSIASCTSVPPVILAIEYPRNLWNNQAMDHTRETLNATHHPNEIGESPVQVVTGPSNDFAWTSAGHLSLEHVKKINHGAFGEVHMVRPTF